jgi:hypothetical protein
VRECVVISLCSPIAGVQGGNTGDGPDEKCMFSP